MTCAHYWQLEPGLSSAIGTCRTCGVERVHTGGIDWGMVTDGLRERKERKANSGKAGAAAHAIKKSAEFNHGTVGYRKHGCRCEVCKSAQSFYIASRKQRETPV